MDNDLDASSRPTLFLRDSAVSPARLLALSALIVVIYLLFFQLVVVATSTVQGPCSASVVSEQAAPSRSGR